MAAGSQGLNAGDGMSFGGDPAELDMNFRTFRSPCRKTCSTIHNPMFHSTRFNLELKAIRPASAEPTKEQKRDLLLKIDWLETGLNAAVREEQAREFDVE